MAHRVWLGPHPAPPEHDYREAWQRTNPDWHLLTWTDEPAGALELVTRHEYDEAPTYVHRADLMYVEAVYACGGIAVGYDVEPLRPIDDLIGEHECWCTPDADGFAGSAFFGAAPHHPAIRHVLDTIRARVAREGWHPTRPNEDTGPWAWGEAFGRFGECCGDYGMALLGDYRTAYPTRYWEKGRLTASQVRARERHAYMRHHFAGSWLKTDVTVRRSACSPSIS